VRQLKGVEAWIDWGRGTQHTANWHNMCNVLQYENKRQKEKTTGRWTHIELVVDRSGSMASMGGETVAGLNNFLQEQRQTQQRNERITASLTTFDDQIETPWALQEISHCRVTAESCQPRGMTALYDAMGDTIARAEATEAAAPHGGKPAMVVVIMTDGQENASHRHKREGIFASIQRLKARGWNFIFLAANQDALATGSSFGIAQGSSLTYTASPAGQRACFGSASAAVQRSRTQGVPASFTATERTTSLAGVPAPRPKSAQVRFASGGGNVHWIDNQLPANIHLSHHRQ